MESLPTNSILSFNSNTLQFIRKLYNMDKQERINDSVDILCDWLKKQDHLVKKNYERDYLERIIVNCKGSVERAKTKLDKLSTYRTTLPIYFEPFDREHPAVNKILACVLPKMTDDHNRIVILKNHFQKFDFVFLEFYRAFMVKAEYLQTFDYNNGFIVIVDYRELNILEFLKVLNLTELEHGANIITEGYGMRIKGIHIITPSKMVDLVVSVLKKALSEKLGERVHVHKNLEAIYNFVPKDIMPIDYGGKEKSLQELSDMLLDEITSDRFKRHIEEMRKAGTNETLRIGDRNIEHLGISGSFRKITID